jgi:hypothetical protein
VNVWSGGAWVEDGRTLARVAIEVLNLGTAPVQLDTNALRLDAYWSSGAQLPPAQLVSTTSPDASLVVPPNESGVIRLVYQLQVSPDDIGSMRLRWAVLHDDGKRYVQFTDFRRVRDYPTGTAVAFYDPIWGYYDPFLYGPPYGYRMRYRVPVGRVIIRDRDRVPQTVRRDR